MIQHSVLLGFNNPHPPYFFNNNVSLKPFLTLFLDLQVKVSEHVPDPLTEGMYLQHKKFSFKIQKSFHTKDSQANSSVHWPILYISRGQTTALERQGEEDRERDPMTSHGPFFTLSFLVVGMPRSFFQRYHLCSSSCTYPWQHSPLTWSDLFDQW